MRQLVTAYAPVGPVADALAALAAPLEEAGIALTQFRRYWDARFWPHAQKGFVPFQERVLPMVLERGPP